MATARAYVRSRPKSACRARAAGQRIRVRLIAGLAAPDRIRLEAMAPFGPPVFILASAGEDTTLLLPRDDRVLRGEPPAAILEALAGIRVTPAALRRLLAGCPADESTLRDVRAIGEDWVLAAPVIGAPPTCTAWRPLASGGRPRRGARRRARPGRSRTPVVRAVEQPRREHRRGLRPHAAVVSGRSGHRRAGRGVHRARAGGRRGHLAGRAAPIGSLARSVRVVIPLVARAHAKINLDLRIVGRRDDGYHDLRTMFQSLALHDRLVFRRTARRVRDRERSRPTCRRMPATWCGVRRRPYGPPAAAPVRCAGFTSPSRRAFRRRPDWAAAAAMPRRR